MNQILLFENDFTGHNRVELQGRRFLHLREIHGAGISDTLKVGLLNGLMGTGRLVNLTPESALLDVTLDTEPPEALPVTLILALPRPKTLKKVLHCATTLGIKEIHVIRSWRVEKSYWQSPQLEEENIMQELVLGLEQARDTMLPTVTFHRLFRPFAEDELPRIAGDTLALVAHPYDSSPCPAPEGRHVTLALGPEGGFIPFEIDLFMKAGFTPVTLGSRILRVEYALPYIAGKLF